MNIYESITAIMTEGYSISKDKTNTQQKFKYRGIDDVMNTFYPLLSKYKVFVVPEVLDRAREERETKSGGNLIYSILRIKYTFYAEDGSYVSAIVVGEGMDSADKSSNKAMAVGMKYAMFQVFCIPTEEMAQDDPDMTTPEPNKPKELICADCGKPIRTITSKDGSVRMTADEIASKSFEVYNRKLCMECSRKAALDRVQTEVVDRVS